jgi:hypothetical protein
VQDTLNSKIGFGFLLGLCALASSAVLEIPAANAQGTSATPAASAKPRTATPLAANTTQADTGSKPAQNSGGAYFVEFRSRSAASYGHTFVWYGRVGDKISAKQIAGLHPSGSSSVTYMLGHILPVAAETGASDGDTEAKYMTARFRVVIGEAEYKRVAARIKEMQATSPIWNAAVYNCNSFAADIARFMGLETPNIWGLPADFINDLRKMNSKRPRTAALSSER